METATPNEHAATRRIIFPAEVRKRLGNIGDVTLWRWRTGKVVVPGFPQPVQVTEHRLGWYADEIDAFIESRPRVGCSQPVNDQPPEAA